MKVLFFISAVIFTAYAGSFQLCVEDNVDYWGADLRNFRANSFAHCAQTCAREQNKGCRSFTYHKGNRHCWLKHTPFGARYTRNRNVLRSANLNCNKYSTLPSWPEDFKWSNAGTPRGYTCVKLWEPRGPATWNDNFMCWRNDRADPGLRWSFAGPISGQRCTRILEGAEPARYTWKDNYLCVQPNSPYQFAWAYSNGLRDHWKRSGKACIQWYEPADPYTWKDNWLCSNRVAGKTVGALPSWPGDFKWSSAGVPKGYNCDRIWEAACPAKYTWKDNFFCWRQNKADPGIRFNMNGAVSNARCTRILEPAELKYTWGDNYLCVPPNSPYHFSWAYSNAMRDNYKKSGNTCIQWIETADPNTWRDNHLCNKPVSNPDPKRHWSVQNMRRVVRRQVTRRFARRTNTYLAGYTSGRHFYPTLGTALNACSKRRDCGGVTWERRGRKGRRYTLRRGKGFRRSPSGEISWLMGAPIKRSNGLSSSEARVENNVDYWGADIRSFRSSGLRDCYNNCRRQKGCMSFTMRKRDNYCWLKRRHNGARRMTNRRHLISANLVMHQRRSARFAALTARWAAIPGRLTRISKGRAGVWGVNRYQNIYVLNSNGRSWTHVAGKLVQISSGSQVWGVNKHDYIFRYLGNNRWQHIPGRLMNIDVSDNGSVWGISRDQKIWRWTGKGWQNVGGRAVQVTVGPAGVWVINRNQDIFYRRGTYGDPNSAGNGWIHIPGKLKWGSSGADIYVGVNRNNDIFYRKGISAKRPTGTNWVHVPGKLMQIEVSGDQVVGTNPGHVIFKAPVVGAFSHTLRRTEGRIENNVDYWGADIRSFRGKGIRDCYSACRRQRGCVSFTMRKRDNYCWLKKRYNGARRTVNRRSLLSVNMSRHVAARALKLRRMKVYRSYIAKYRRAAAIQRKRLHAFNVRYNKAHAAALNNVRWNHKMVALAKANARAANAYRRKYLIYIRRYKAVRAGCIKAQRKWAGVANAQVRVQRVMIARMNMYRKRAAVYRKRYVASLKLFRTRAAQRKSAYALYNKYVKTSNYWVKRFNAVARG